MSKPATIRKPRAAAAPADETKAAAFSRLASKRVQKALKAIANIGNLSGANYEYNDEQVNKIFAAIKDKAGEAYGRFQAKGKTASEPEFTV